MPTRLILIRHGATEWNLKMRYCGWHDVGLSALGRKQARALAKRLKQAEIDKVYSSDRLRAIQTAGIVFPGRKAQRIKGLREMHFGCFEGFTHDEILKKYPVIYKKWLKDPFSVAIPKGEILKGFQKRVLGSIHRIIRDNKHKTAAVVVHGGVVSILMLSLKTKRKGFWRYIPHAASFSVLEFRGKTVKIKTFNDILHLNE